MKIEIIHVDHLVWRKPEWSDNQEALAATAAGYELEVAPSIERQHDWDWVTKHETKVIELGTARSVSGAKRGAGTAANNHQRRSAKANSEAPVKATAAPVKASGTPGEKLDKVEAQVAEAMKPKKRSRKPSAKEAVAA